jgi:hypothetical protein
MLEPRETVAWPSLEALSVSAFLNSLFEATFSVEKRCLMQFIVKSRYRPFGILSHFDISLMTEDLGFANEIYYDRLKRKNKELIPRQNFISNPYFSSERSIIRGIRTSSPFQFSSPLSS